MFFIAHITSNIPHPSLTGTTRSWQHIHAEKYVASLNSEIL